jgi:hypothetical protein
VLEAAGLRAVARELLDRVSPTSSCAKKVPVPTKELITRTSFGNDPLD